ncbi:hypothetical protein [Providencia alcalifaciens]|uniref:hypothetical protein n=1 Tax=Providencia alcalifaciens TaxID=126385 RepID=UPI0003E1D306|nr:hypothetical protein [Providencia alcalifaciens]ETT02841.1 hypothetical protein HMPREF1568_1731 [Providencia alcalifaciens PAL-3]EUD01432.1 hypothetical protein HMPREF1566_0638 [Providencia alcalifaciens PAL-1]
MKARKKKYEDLDSIIKERDELKDRYDSLKFNHNKLRNYLISEPPDKNVNCLDTYTDYYKYAGEGGEIINEYNKKCNEINEIKAELIETDKLIYKYWNYNILPLTNQALYDKWESEYVKLDDQHNFDTSISCIAEGVARMNKEVSISDHVKSAEITNFYHEALFGVPVYITDF